MRSGFDFLFVETGLGIFLSGFGKSKFIELENVMEALFFGFHQSQPELMLMLIFRASDKIGPERKQQTPRAPHGAAGAGITGKATKA